MSTRRLSAVSVLFLLAFTTPLYSQNLVVNGGFESGFAGWTGTYGIYSTPKPVDGTHVGVVVDAASSSVNQSLTQTIPTIPGQTYAIDFALRLPDLFEVAPGVWIPVVGDHRATYTTVFVRWDLQTLATLSFRNRDTWSFYSLQAVALDNSTELNFFHPFSKAWPFIDAVSVTMIPEPCPLRLSFIGVALALAARAFRHNPRSFLALISRDVVATR